MPCNDVARYDYADMPTYHPLLSDVDGGVSSSVVEVPSSVRPLFVAAEAHASSKAVGIKDSVLTVIVEKPAVDDTSSAADMHPGVRPLSVVTEVDAGERPLSVVAPVDSNSDVALDSAHTVKLKEFMRTMRLRQGISDERNAELELEKQAAAAAPPPPPQPQMTLEDLQSQMAAHRLRHLAMDHKYEESRKQPRKKKPKQSVVE
jgi:hypothetical protein